jgi:dihydrofolate reductase
MSRIFSTIAMSLDGYVAGPNISVDNPLGEGGENLHDWFVPLKEFNEIQGREGGETTESSAVVREWADARGATVMGRGMFSGGSGPWEEDPNPTGWWGPNPPYHHQVFILTHHPRDPVEMEGGTTFNFVTDGVEAAAELAREAAGEKDVLVAGGAEVINQFLAAGLLEEIQLSVVPILLGGGSRLLENVPTDVKLEQDRVVEAPGVVHLRYRVGT